MTYYEERIHEILPEQAVALAKSALSDETRRKIREVSKTLGLRVGRATSWQRCLPSFVIIGAMRSGTTALYNLVCDTRATIPAVKKEVHYFDNNHERSLAWYRSHFCTIRRRDRLHAEVGQPVACGEASPYYLYHPEVPARMSRVLPNIRLVAVLRNPVDRAYSHYWHVRNRGDERRDFSHVVEENLRQALRDGSPWRHAGPGSADHQWLSYFDRGFYVRQLERWLRHFNREQLLLLRTADLKNRPDRVLRDLTEHLGQDPEVVVPDELILDKRQNANSYPPMSPASRATLTDVYGDWEAEIREEIGWS